MSLFSASRKAQAGKTPIALFNIGSGSVHGALLELPDEAGERPCLIHGIGEDFLFSQQVHAARLGRVMLTALEKVALGLREAAHERGTLIERGLLTFAAPWFSAETKLLHYEHDAPVEVTAATIDALIEEAWRRFGTSPSTTARTREERESASERALIEQSVLRVALNGYRTSAPINKMARTIEVALYLSRTSQRTLDEIDTILTRTMPRATVVPHSSAFVFASVLRDVFPMHEDVLLCQEGAEMTELVLILEGVLLETVSFPYGAHTLVRELSSALKSNPAATLSLLSLERTAVDEKTNRRISDALGKLGEQWLTELAHSLAALADTHGSMPNWFLVIGENTAMAERFRQFLESRSDRAMFPGTGTLRSAIISEQTLGTRLTCEGSALPCMRDIPLACEALFARSSSLSTR